MNIKYLLAALLVAVPAYSATVNLSGIWQGPFTFTIIHNTSTKVLNVTTSMESEETGSIVRTFSGKDDSDEDRYVSAYLKSSEKVP